MGSIESVTGPRDAENLGRRREDLLWQSRSRTRWLRLSFHDIEQGSQGTDIEGRLSLALLEGWTRGADSPWS
jgi:hypothetical protein